MFGFKAISVHKIVSAAVAARDYSSNLILSLKGENPFNGNRINVILDRSVNTVAVTRAGDGNQQVSSFSPFSSGASYYFDGTGDTISWTGTTLSADFTIECWFYQTAKSAQYVPVISGTTGTYNFPLILDYTGTGRVGFYLTDTTAGNSGVSTFNLNTWNHVALTRSGNSLRLFLNGSQVATATSSASVVVNTIGGWTGSAGYLIIGHVSNARIVNGTALYTSAFIPSTSTLPAVVNTSLLTCHATRLFDGSTNNFDLTVAGNTTASTFSPFDKTELSGSIGSTSVFFDGNGDYLSVPSSTGFDFAAGDFTIECWAYRTGAGTGDRFLVSRGNAANFLLRWNASGVLQFYLNSTLINSYTYSFPLNNWVHIAVAREGSICRMFVNGAEVSSVANTTDVSSAVNTVLIGGFTSSDYFQGYISNVRIVKGTAVYTGSFTPSSSALTAVSGTSLLTLQDSSFKDNSANARVMTRNGDVMPYSISPFGGGSNWSGYFDGTGDYLTVADAAALNMGSSDFTIECWFFPTVTPNNTLFSKRANTSIYGGTSVTFTNSLAPAVYATVDGSSWGIGSTSSVSCVLNTWNHIAWTRSGSTWRLFVNGQVGVTATLAGTVPTNVAAFTVGATAADGSSAISSSYISNFRIVKGTALYTSAFTPSASPLTAVAGTSLLTLQGSSFTDNSSNAFSISRLGNTEIRRAGPFGAPNVWSGYFDGTGDYLTLPSNSLNFMHQGSSSWTFETWIYSTTSVDRAILSTTGSTAQTGFLIYVTATGQVSLEIYRGSSGNSYTGTTPAGVVTTGAWQHLAVTFDGTSKAISIFVDGRPQTVTTAGTASFSASNATYAPDIGRWMTASVGAGGYFTGYISNLRVVQGSILYSSTFTPSSTALTAVSGTAVLTLQNSAFRDNSSNAYAITKSGDTVAREVSPFNLPTVWSGYFDGTGDYISTASDAAFAYGTGDFTVEFWAFVNDWTTTKIWANSTSATQGFSLYISGSRIRAWGNNVEFMSGSTAGYANNAWYHIAFVRSGSTNTIYVNGTAVTITVGSSTNSTNYPAHGFVAGGYTTASTSSATYMSNLRVVKGTAVYTSNFTPSTSALTAINGTSLLTLQNDTFVDNSSNRFTLTVAGNSVMQPGGPFTEAGIWSSYFDGVGDYLALPSGSIDFMHQGTASWTFDTWLYSTSTVAQAMLSTTSASAQTGIYLAINNFAAGDVTVAFSRSSAGNQYIGRSPAGKIVPNTWNHVAVTYNGTSKAISIFINGVPQPVTVTGTATFSASAASNAPSIGRDFSSGAAGGYFIGYMSNMRIVQGSILYTSAFTPSTSALTAVSGTSLLACDGAAITDNSSTNATVTAGGDARVAGFSPFNNAGGWAAFFDGTGDIISTPSNTAFALPGDFTVEAWVYIAANSSADSSNARTAIIASTQGFSTTATDGFTFQITGNSTTTGTGLSAEFRVGGTNTGYGATIAVAQGTWNHIAFVRSGTTLTYYLNGISAGTSTVSQNIPAGGLTIGGQNMTGWNRYLNGYISNLRIVKGTAVYTSNFTPSTSALTAVAGTSILTLQDNTFKDNSSNVFTLTPAGDVAVRGVGPFAEPNVWSAYFDGTGDYLTAASSNYAFGTGDFTIECWIFSEDVSTATQRGFFQTSSTVGGFGINYGTGVIIAQGVTAAGGSLTGALTVGIAGGSINGATFIGSNTAVLTTNRWYHIAVTRQSGTVRLFIDGALNASGTAAGNCTGTNMVIGGYYSTAYLYKGYISNLRVIKGTALYTSDFTPSSSRFTAVSGTSLLTLQDNTFRDNSGDAVSINRAGDVVMRPHGPFAATFPASTTLFPGSVYFDGTNDYLTIPSSAALNVLGGDFTIECWFNPISFNASNYNYLIMQDDGGNGNQNFQLTCSAAGLASFTTWNTSSRASVFGITSTRSVKLGAWNHIAVTHVKSTNTTRLFLNGRLEASSTTAIWAGSAQPTCIGNWTPGAGIQNSTYGKLNGHMAGVRLIKGSALYTSAFVPPTAPPIATADTALLLNFNDGGTVDAYGSSGSFFTANTGVVSNSVIKKSGTGSLYFPATYMVSAPHPDYALGTGDFTIEFWLNSTNASNSSRGILNISSTAPSSFGPTNEGVGIKFASSNLNGLINFFIGGSVQTGTINATNAAWTHVALCRSAGTVRLFVGGVLSTKVASSANITGQYLTLGAGGDGLAYPMTGYLDNLAIYKGYAKYTADTTFTPV